MGILPAQLEQNRRRHPPLDGGQAVNTVAALLKKAIANFIHPHPLGGYDKHNGEMIALDANLAQLKEFSEEIFLLDHPGKN